jgi:hypothetical protein
LLACFHPLQFEHVLLCFALYILFTSVRALQVTVKRTEAVTASASLALEKQNLDSALAAMRSELNDALVCTQIRMHVRM